MTLQPGGVYVETETWKREKCAKLPENGKIFPVWLTKGRDVGARLGAERDRV